METSELRTTDDQPDDMVLIFSSSLLFSTAKGGIIKLTKGQGRPLLTEV